MSGIMLNVVGGTFTVPIPAIGAAYQGGFFAGQIGVSGVATHNLVVGPVASAQTGSQWKDSNDVTAGSDSVTDGAQNTADMVADGNSTVYPAAHFCNDLVIGGFSDWYLPAKNESEICYYNLKPTTNSNNTSSGINANAIPARTSNYSSGDPARTSVTAFQDGGAEAYAGVSYWSSTETSSSQASWQYFSYGLQSTANKTGFKRIRAIRKVAV